MDQHYRENIRKLGYNTMNKPNILKSDVKTLHLYANNAKPHNIIFFDDNKFMQHVKHVLYNNFYVISFYCGIKMAHLFWLISKMSNLCLNSIY